MSNEVALKNDNGWIHRLFYWTYDEGYVLSKSKLASVSVFLYLFLLWAFAGENLIFIVLSLMFGLLTFLIGFLFHHFLPKPSEAKIKNNDNGLITDILHLLFFWQDNNGNYRPSKTKIISIAVFAVVFSWGVFYIKIFNVFSSVIFALLIEIPIFAVGSGIHKLTSKPAPKKELPPKKEEPKEVEQVREIPIKATIVPEYFDYQVQLDNLNSKFAKKEKSTRQLIEKRFQPPQLTYTRFIGGVDRSSELFKRNIESAYRMINLADEYSPRIASEIESKIKISREIIDKLDALSNELLLNENLSKDEDVDELIDEMDNLIRSVKNYDT